ncbi:MAG: hypothetical protein EHM20_16450 [Alphaproteobacteria bacterium]|nr:MAG: hypothetical protein EHM20_16450 [Alphaproteobacteria bacterium]
MSHFYDTKEGLIDILTPYFKAGLENNEFCLWVTSKQICTLTISPKLVYRFKN